MDEATLAAFSAEWRPSVKRCTHPRLVGRHRVRAGVSVGRRVWLCGHRRGYSGFGRNTLPPASVTKPIAAVADATRRRRRRQLNDPVAQYGVRRDNPDITVWHLLTHTSEGVPGTTHQYSGNYYADLGQVIQAATGQPVCHVTG